MNQQGAQAVQDNLSISMDNTDITADFKALSRDEHELVRALADICHLQLQAGDNQIFKLVSSFAHCVEVSPCFLMTK